MINGALDSAGPDGARGAEVGTQLERSQFVLGIFRDPPVAQKALQGLLAGEFQAGQLLLVAASSGQMSEALGPGDMPRIHTCQLDGHVGNDELLRQASTAASPFSPLWQSMRAHLDGQDGAKGSAPQRIYTQLRHDLGAGAVVVIVSVDRTEAQRSAARTLLDCKCDVLLTHEVSARSG
jgi:hypothetical protein